MELLGYLNGKADHLCAFTSTDGGLGRRFMSAEYKNQVFFLSKDGLLDAYGHVVQASGFEAYTLCAKKGDRTVWVTLVSPAETAALYEVPTANHMEHGLTVQMVTKSMCVIRQLDYIISRTKSELKPVKYHYLEFKQVEPSLSTKALMPRLAEKRYAVAKDAPALAELSPRHLNSKSLVDCTDNGLVVYPLFNRLASQDGFVCVCNSQSGYVVKSVGPYLPCICVRVKGKAQKVYEISLSCGLFGEGPQPLATTKNVDKVEGIIKSQISSALLGTGNQQLRNVLCKHKYYRCIRRRYTNEEFLKDIQAERDRLAAQFVAPGKMSDALRLGNIDHESLVGIWEICNRAVNK